MDTAGEQERILKWGAVVASAIAAALGIVRAAVWMAARGTFTLVLFP